MKKLLGLGALLVLPLAPAFSEPGAFKVHTTPAPPTREALHRLNLNMAWRAKVPTEGKRDGLFSLQLIPGPDRPQLVVQTFAGAVLLLDAETGDPLWRTSVGLPYWQAQPVGYNETSILATRREFLYILDRATGAHRLYRPDVATGKPVYGTPLPAVPSAAPSADDAYAIFCFENRVAGFKLPAYNGRPAPREAEPKKDEMKTEEPPSEEGKEQVSAQDPVPEDFVPEEDEPAPDDPQKNASPQPVLRWNFFFERLHFLQPPLGTAAQAGVVSTDGTFMSLTKAERFIRNSYKLSGGVAAASGQHGTIAYIPSEDYTLYALNMLNARLVWRFLAGGPILRKPDVTDRDVFVAPDRSGLFRVDRATGEEVWQNRKAERFLAANPRFVYALDRQGNLLVLDYLRGTELARYDARDWIIAVPNELTDRVYLAAHDGQILCLHHRDYAQPVYSRERKAPEPAPEPEKKNGEKKNGEKTDNGKQALVEPGPTLLPGPTFIQARVFDREVERHFPRPGISGIRRDHEPLAPAASRAASPPGTVRPGRELARR